MALIEQERWADAILELQRARDLRVTPPVLYNLGLSYRAVGRNREAMGAFRAFSRTPGAAADAALAGRVDAYVRELAAGLGWLELQVEPPTARVRVDSAGSGRRRSRVPPRASTQLHCVSSQENLHTTTSTAVRAAWPRVDVRSRSHRLAQH